VKGVFLLENFYAGKYKIFLGIAIVILVIMGIFAFVWPGITKGIDLSGGTLLIARTDKAIDSAKLSDAISSKLDLVDLSVSSIASPTGYGVTIKYAQSKVLAAAQAEIDTAKALLEKDPNSAEAKIHADNAIAILAKYIPEKQSTSIPAEAVANADVAFTEAKTNINKQIQDTLIQTFGLAQETAFQIKEVSPTLGASFWQTAINVVIIVLILVIIVVFFFFREIIPSIVVFSCGIFDVVFSLGAMAFFGIPLGLNTIPALLMLMGYSIDTDVMVASRVLTRKEGTPEKRASSSMITGFTMTGTTIAAVAVMVVISYVYQVGVIFDIGSVLLLGLIGDLIGTWLMSASLLLWYSDLKRKKMEKKFR
jgi:preprotein translocase subunit SecF